MKIDKVKLFGGLALLLGGIGSILTLKSDEYAREEMKAELKDELLSELNKESD